MDRSHSIQNDKNERGGGGDERRRAFRDSEGTPADRPHGIRNDETERGAAERGKAPEPEREPTGGDRGIASPRGDGLGEGRDRRRGDEQRERPEESVARPEESEEDFRRGLY